MKTLLVILILIIPSIQPARAGSVAGTGGGLETTQILNNIQLANSYAQMLTQYQNELMQYETMIKNLAAHPSGDMGMTFNTLITNQARVIRGSKDIGSTMARVDQDFAGQFQSPIAASFAEKFRGWTTHSNDGLKAMALNAGAQREGFQSDEDALKALVEKNRASDGNLGALKTLGEINAQQLQESMKLRDLISQQQVAEASYMAAKNSQGQARRDAEQQELDNTMPREIKPMPTPRQKSKTTW